MGGIWWRRLIDHEFQSWKVITFQELYEIGNSIGPEPPREEPPREEPSPITPPEPPPEEVPTSPAPDWDGESPPPEEPSRGLKSEEDGGFSGNAGCS